MSNEQSPRVRLQDSVKKISALHDKACKDDDISTEEIEEEKSMEEMVEFIKKTPLKKATSKQRLILKR